MNTIITVGEIKLASGSSGERTDAIDVCKDINGPVLLRVNRGDVVVLKLPPSIARRVAGLLLEAAGPEKPLLEIVENGDVS